MYLWYGILLSLYSTYLHRMELKEEKEEKEKEKEL